MRNGATRPAVLPATIIGLIVALGVPLAYTVGVRPLLTAPTVDVVTIAFMGFAVMWAAAAIVVMIVRKAERRAWVSIGIRRTQLRWVAAAVGFGVVLAVLVPALTLLGAMLVPSESGGVADVAGGFTWPVLLASVITAAITEELLFRAYAIERLTELTGSPAIAVLVSLACFTVLHAGSWNLAHVLFVVLPLGLALSLLYLWRRNLLVVVIAHFVADLPLVIIAAVSAG